MTTYPKNGFLAIVDDQLDVHICLLASNSSLNALMASKQMTSRHPILESLFLTSYFDSKTSLNSILGAFKD